jgi:thiosulfate/3-mercaptopyruvate sulfurtransferase
MPEVSQRLRSCFWGPFLAAWLLLGVPTRAAPGNEAQVRQLLKTAAEVQRHLHDGAWRIVDTRDEAAYQAGHIPGALRIASAQWTAQGKSLGGLTDREFWSTAVGQLGLEPQMQVVVYGADAASAARVWWLLKFVGLQRVAILDGGWKAWQRAGYAASTESPQVEPRPFPVEFQHQRVLEMPEVLRNLAGGHLQIVDTRSRGEYMGADVKGSRPGRVPGAVHLEWVELLDENGQFKKPAELRQLLDARGIKPGTPVATYCYSGGRASVGAFAFELLGFPQVKNYYCGWQEWSAHEQAPAEVDPQAKDATEKKL